MAIFFALLIVAAASGVYFFVLSTSRDSVTGWSSDASSDRPKTDLGDFDVHMRDTRIGDVFTAFPEDEGAVITAQSLAGEWDRFKVDRSQPQFRHGATHSFVG